MTEHTNRVRGLWLASPLFAMAALTACTTEPQEASVSTVDHSLSQRMAIDSQYMMGALAAKTSAQSLLGTQSLQIDLADPAQHRFVMNRLAAAGKTADNSPYLFERVQQARDKALARTADKLSSAATTSAFTWCKNLVTLGQEVRTSTTTIQFRTTRPNVTCVNGADYVYADVTTYNANTAGTEAFLVQSAAGEDYTGGRNFNLVGITPTLPSNFGRVNKTDSLIIAYDALGNEQMTFSAVQTALAAVPGTITVTHPVLHPWLTNGGFIQMCQLRGFPTQCDYAVGQLAAGTFTGWAATTTGIASVKDGAGTATVPWEGDPAKYFAFTAPYNASRIYLPLQGTFNVGATDVGACAITSVELAKVDLIKTVDGGTCTTTSNFTASVTFPTGGNPAVGSFRGIGEFVNDGGTSVAATCTQAAILNEDVRPVMTIRARATCGGVPNVLRIMLQAPGSGPALPHRAFFLNSCFAEGTGIRLASGKTVTVESVKAGDKVISDSKGTILTVTGVSHGNEDEPLVELRDNKGHKIQLTSKHPLVKASGEVVFASSLKTSDQVMTDRGIATIVSAKRVDYTGQVYNLTLGTPDEKAKVGKDGTTMFAGGFLAGDATMQQTHELRRPEVAAVSKAWQRDYQNASANNPPMMRVLR